MIDPQRNPEMPNPVLEAKRERQKTHGWFHTEKRPGDRSLYQQMTGLAPLLAEVKGSTVLDVGCAEGLIGIELAKHGAKAVLGLELVPGHLEIANKIKGERPCKFLEADANDYVPTEHYDIVLMLAILHKLRDPSGSCARIVKAASSLCVIRLPPSGPVIEDDRSGKVPHDIHKVMVDAGFKLEREEMGPFLEWMGYYRRVISGG